MNTTSQLATLKAESAAVSVSDARVDMFSAKGFALAQRIAAAFAASDAVPAQFRTYNLKKVNNQDQWVENPSAIGNCLVAIEVAQSVGMSVTAVMQNADMIEGKLRWNDRFVVAGINASKRFTPLRFDVKNLGPIEASYKEKTGWDQQARKMTFETRSVNVDNLVSIAWALPYGFETPPGIYTLDQARAAGLPVIEGPPVSMKLAVEEGWYAKSGSKWQTELKHKMLMMRSGRYFGDIHAPDVVMGIGRTSDEERDIIDTVRQPDGSYAAATPINDLRTPTAYPQDVAPQSAGDQQPPAEPQTQPQQPSNGPSFEDAMQAVRDGDYDTAADIARGLPEGQHQQISNAIANAINGAQQQQSQQQQQTVRRQRGNMSVE